jgi:hypothetical protein
MKTRSSQPRPSPWLGLLLPAVFAACNQILDISAGQPFPTGGGAAPSAGGGDPGGDTKASGSGGASSQGSGGGSGAAGGAPGVLDDCILLLHMDEPSWTGTGAVKDASGKGNHGTSVNAASTANGKFGRAALLDGTNWIEVPDSASLRASIDELTYAAWIYPTQLSSSGSGVISKRMGFESKSAFAVFLYGQEKVNADIHNTRLESVGSVPLQAWSHVAVVYDAALPERERMRIYIDGVFDSARDADPVIATNTQQVLIGNLIGGGGTYYGRIDEVAIWRRALSAAEIGALHRASGPIGE